MNDLESKLKILNRFVDKNGQSVRYALSKPFMIGPRIFATDAKIMAWCHGKLPDQPDSGDLKFPPCEVVAKKYFDESFDDGREVTAHLRERVRSKCDTCEGTKKVSCSCPDCKGKHDCDMCDADTVPAITLNNRRFQKAYLRKIFALPDARFKVVGSSTPMLIFEAGDIRGLLMGMGEV